jgi:multiple sugar transport system permease protein
LLTRVTAGGVRDASEVEDRTEIERELRRARRRYLLRRNGVAYLFLAPNLVVFTLFLVVPIGWVVRQSFLEGGLIGSSEWAGLDNWEAVFSDPAVTNSLRNTLVYALIVTPVVMALAMVLALLLREVRRGGSVLRATLYFPSLTSFLLAALVWVFVVHPDFGLLNIGNRALGLEPTNWLGDESLALPSLAMLDIWRGTGFWALLLLAGLLAVPGDLYQAAALDGASRWRRFWHVTLPSMRPTLIMGTLLSLLFSLQVFDSVFILTQGGPAGATDVVVFSIYKSTFESGEPGRGAALSVLMLLAILVLTFLFVRAFRTRMR